MAFLANLLCQNSGGSRSDPSPGLSSAAIPVAVLLTRNQWREYLLLHNDKVRLGKGHIRLVSNRGYTCVAVNLLA